MKRSVYVARAGAVVLACGVTLAFSAVPASARPCPPGSNIPVYCASLKAQVAQIRKSALEIEASYNSIVASARQILARVHTRSVIAQVDALLAKGAKLDAKKIRLLRRAESERSVYTQRATVSEARMDIAEARVDAAKARLIAAIAVVTGG